jgi:hypothetical protein
MSNTVEFGGWPRPPRWVWAVAGVAAVAALAGVIIAHTGPHRGASAAGTASAAATRRAAGQGGLRMPPRKPARMAGQPLPHDAGLRLALGGRRPAWLWVGTGRTEPVRGLPRRSNGYQLIRAAGGWAALPFPGNDGSCGNCAPRPVWVYYIAAGSRTATRLGTADFAAPAAATGAMWLVSYRAGAAMPATAAAAQEVSVSGTAFGPRRRLPRGYVITQGTTAGLLLTPEHTHGGAVRYQLWQPGPRRASRWFTNVIAASPHAIAWMPACTARCTVHVLNLASGTGRTMSLPARSHAYQGAFSPDGKLLALQVTAPIVGDDRAAFTRLVVTPVASGRLTAVPGTTVGAGTGVDFGWAADSRRLVADVGLPDAWQVSVWRPGDTQLHVTVTRAPDGSWPVLGPGPY